MKDEAGIKKLSDDIQRFTSNLARSHVISKSLILNAAFACEALVNNLIRVGAAAFHKERPEILKQSLSLNFSEKLKFIDFYCPLIRKLDVSEQVIKDALALMTLRNKFAHADESSDHNKLGQVHFDELFPVFEADGRPFLIQSIQKTYEEPGRSFSFAFFECSEQSILPISCDLGE